jgi:hypothetical protein
VLHRQRRLAFEHAGDEARRLAGAPEGDAVDHAAGQRPAVRAAGASFSLRMDLLPWMNGWGMIRDSAAQAQTGAPGQVSQVSQPQSV